MHAPSVRKHYSKEALIRMLSRDERNRVCEYWAGMVKGKEGSHTGGINLVTHNKYYSGWAPALEEECEFISAPELASVMDVCDSFPWGCPALGGVEYRLKPEFRSQS